MACKRYIVAALTLLCIAACTPEYELKIPLALNRTEMRFRSTGDSYYVMVSCAGAWTAELDGEAPWLSLSRTEGGGNAQIMVTAEVNDGVSRGVTMTVRSGDLSREMYISQAGGLSDGGSYGFVKSSLDLLREACTAQIRAGTNMDAGTLSRVSVDVEYEPEGELWVHDVVVGSDRVTFSADANSTGDSRSATVKLTFPLAKWDEPVTAFFIVNQSAADPSQISASISPLGDIAPVWTEADKLMLVDADGISFYPAQTGQASISGASATFIYNSESVKDGIAGAVYPEMYVTSIRNGKVVVSLPEKADFITSVKDASALGFMVGELSGGDLSFRSACTILSVSIGGSGTLKDLSLLFDTPVCGPGTIDLNDPVYVPDPDKGCNIITLALPGEGVSLPTKFYLAVPSGNVGGVMANAVTTSWSGSVRADSEIDSSAHTLVPMEEISLSLPSGATDLTEGGKWGNCFLVDDSAEKMYSIGIKKADGTAVEASRCGIIWQSSPRLLGYLGIDSAAGKLYFRKNAGESGNALVSVQDSKGTVLWSYHIWAPATPVQERTFGEWTFMDRNLGAVEDAVGDHSGRSVGMHYQWGRKDPFPPMDDLDGKMLSGKVYPDAITFMTAQNGVKQELADATPATYYWGNDNSGTEDWIEVQDDNLWGAKNTVSNPCPHGWVVAPKQAFEAAIPNLKAGVFTSKFGVVASDDNGASTLFPVGGHYRRKKNDSEQLASSTEGWIWTSTPWLNGNLSGSWYLHIASGVDSRKLDTVYSQRRWGKNVRCVKK